MENLRLTIVQSDIIWHSPVENISKFESLIDPYAGATDLILLPEMFSTGFTMTPEKFAEPMDGGTVTAMRRWSSRLNAFIAGSLIIQENGRFYNRFIFAGPDGSLSWYDKRHLFRMGGEHEVYAAGVSNITVKIRGWRVRPFICYDLRFPVWSRNSGMEYDLAVYCANWPAARSFHWDTLLRARAIENQCYAAGVNRTGSDGKGVKYSGGSCIAGFRGETIWSADDEPSVNTTELSYPELELYREEFPAWKDADNFRITL